MNAVSTPAHDVAIAVLISVQSQSDCAALRDGGRAEVAGRLGSGGVVDGDGDCTASADV